MLWRRWRSLSLINFTDGSNPPKLTWRPEVAPEATAQIFSARAPEKAPPSLAGARCLEEQMRLAHDRQSKRITAATIIVEERPNATIKPSKRRSGFMTQPHEYYTRTYIRNGGCAIQRMRPPPRGRSLSPMTKSGFELPAYPVFGACIAGKTAAATIYSTGGDCSNPWWACALPRRQIGIKIRQAM